MAKTVGMGYSQDAKQVKLEQENAILKKENAEMKDKMLDYELIKQEKQDVLNRIAELEKELEALKAEPQAAKTKKTK